MRFCGGETDYLGKISLSNLVTRNHFACQCGDLNSAHLHEVGTAKDSMVVYINWTVTVVIILFASPLFHFHAATSTDQFG